MVYDIADSDSSAASDEDSYEARFLRFQEAREASKALWHWQEVDTAARSEEDTGRDALDDTPFFAGTFSLGDTFLADSAPQDLRARASANTAQAPLAIFLAREDISSLTSAPPAAFKGTPDTARVTDDTPPSSQDDLECRPAAPPASDTADALLTAGDLESLDSSISPCAGAIKPRAQASSAVNTPPPLVSVSSSKRAAPVTRQNTANASMPAFAAGVPSLFHRTFSLPAPRQLLLPFTHRLPPLLRRDLPPPPPPSQPARKALDSKSQAQSQPLSLDSWRGVLKRHYSSEAHRLEAPSNKQRADSSGDSDDAAPLPSPLAGAAEPLSPILDVPQLPVSNIWQPRAPKDDDRLDSGYSTDQDDTASAHSGEHKRSASNSASSPSISRQRADSSGDSDDAAPPLAGAAAPLSTFPDISEPLDADLGRRRALLDTGQHLRLGNSSATRAHIDKPQHSAAGAADNPEAAEAALLSALENSDADYSDSSRSNSGKPERGTEANSIYDDSPGSSERSASDSADNPSAVASTAHHFTDERDDERSARGEGDGGVGFSSEAAARVPSSQLGGEPSVCRA
jgi:hypothetical protein